MTGEGYELEPIDLSDPEPAGPVLGTSVRCIRCGYDLRGLAPSGQCPECGAPVQDSLRGDRLEFSAPAYVATLHRGAIGVLVALGMYVGLIVLGMALEMQFTVAGQGQVSLSNELTDAMVLVLDVAGSVLMLVSWWLLSTPDPASMGTNTGSKSRVVLRGALIGRAVVTVAGLFTVMLVRVAPGSVEELELVVWVVGLVAFAVQFFASMLYLRWLSPRLPNEHLAKRATQLMWGGPLLMTVGAIFCFIGPIVALGLYFTLLNWLRMDLKRIRIRQARMG